MDIRCVAAGTCAGHPLSDKHVDQRRRLWLHIFKVTLGTCG
jgi:hypothetical protein